MNMYKDLADVVKMQNGVDIPWMGAGVFKVDNTITAQVVMDAIDEGYRLIDTAAAYANEAGVGDGIRQSRVKREEIFVTTKLANHQQGYDSTLTSFDESLRQMGLDYVDLYLIHWPIPSKDKYIETWRAFEQIYKSGRTRAIGVSNFKEEHLQRVIDTCEIVPMLNQVEYHPYLVQDELAQYMRKHNILLQAWSPLAKGQALSDPEIISIAQKHKKAPVQVVLRWAMQKGILVIPKTTSKARMADNANIFDFALSEEDIFAIDARNSSTRTGPDPDIFGA